MSQELIYTSVPQGLKPGSKGFCTVAMTAGMPAALVERLESLSGYRAVFPLGDPNSTKNPVTYAHWRVSAAGKTQSVLSRVAFAGVDYSQRSNKFAHHLVLDSAEETVAGPAWLLTQPGLMLSNWSQPPMLLQTSRPIPDADRPARPCTAWAAATGDAGWAGVLAEAYLEDSTKPAYLVYPAGVNILPLVEEALALLPPEMRWRVTFSTYFTDLPLGLTCAWRGVASGTPATKDVIRGKDRVFQIGGATMGRPADSPIVAQARTGQYSPATRDQTRAGTSAKSGQVPLAKEDEEATLPQKVAEVLQVASSTHRRRLSATPQDLVEEIVADKPQPARYRAPVAVFPSNQRGVPVWVAIVAGIACLALGGLGGASIMLLQMAGRADPVRYGVVGNLTESPANPPVVASPAQSQPTTASTGLAHDQGTKPSAAQSPTAMSQVPPSVVVQGSVPQGAKGDKAGQSSAPMNNEQITTTSMQATKTPPEPLIRKDYNDIDVTVLPVSFNLTAASHLKLAQHIGPVAGLPSGANDPEIIFPTNATRFQAGGENAWTMRTQPDRAKKSIELLVDCAKKGWTRTSPRPSEPITVCIIELGDGGVQISGESRTENAVTECRRIFELSTLVVSGADGVRRYFQWPVEAKVDHGTNVLPPVYALADQSEMISPDRASISRLSGAWKFSQTSAHEFCFTLVQNPDVKFTIALSSPSVDRTHEPDTSSSTAQINCHWATGPDEIKSKVDDFKKQLQKAQSQLDSATKAKNEQNIGTATKVMNAAKIESERWEVSRRAVDEIGTTTVKFRLLNGVTLASVDIEPTSFK